MYISSLRLRNIKSFSDSGEISFLYPGKEGESKPKFPNINLLLGNNGSGKTTILKAIALAALGPAVREANLPIFRVIRKTLNPAPAGSESTILGTYFINDQDIVSSELVDLFLESPLRFSQIGDVERVDSAVEQNQAAFRNWEPVFSNSNDAFFFVGYGATRRVEGRDTVDAGTRQKSFLARAQRIRSLFEDSYSLYPLSIWLPALKDSNPGRYAQVKDLLNDFLADTPYRFTGDMDQGEFVFATRSIEVPYPALSDGYRTFIGWLGDLLYHVVITCPAGKKLVENQGMVLVDEVDLHLHPQWQMTILPRLSKTLKKVQFIVTSHSPLVVGSLERFNILFLKNTGKSTKVERLDIGVHGLDADQILISDFFGFGSTRAEGKEKRLKALTKKAVLGDKDSALEMLEAMSKGLEDSAL